MARERIIYPVMNRDERLDAFQNIIGIKKGNSTAALIKNNIVDKKLVFFKLDEFNLISVYDPALDTVRVFESCRNYSQLDIDLVDGFLFDKDTGNKWNLKGEAVNRNLSNLVQVQSFEVLWFGWVAYYPDTILIVS